MVRLPPRRRIARAWLAIALSYLLGLNAILVVAASARGDTVGTLCAQGRSAPDQSNHSEKAHACCLAAHCGAGAVVAGAPADAAGIIIRYAWISRRAATVAAQVGGFASRGAFGARAPPSSV